MKDITVIIPLHKHDEETEKLLTRAIDSVPSDYKVIISTTHECFDSLNGVSTRDGVTCVYNADDESKSDFSTLVNYGVTNVETHYFSILEYDDEYTSIWFNNVETYIEYKPETSVFLPLNDLIDFNNNKFVGYGNEAPWASSFSNEIGYIDNDCLQQYFDFYLTGAVFNTADWVACGGLKPSIKLTFWYEFLLRVTNGGKKVFVVPKIGYKHYVNRKGSLFDEYRDVVSEKESSWWFETAKKESFFKNDRNKTYSVEEGE